MSSGGDSRSRGRAAEQIGPQELEKVIKNLRDALNKNLSDDEILDVLLECDMDVDAAFQRLLSQDAFQQVKSKRERRKEIKEMQALQAWIKNDETIHRSRVGSGSSSVRGGCTQSDSIDPCKVAYERDSGSGAPTLHPSSTSDASARISNEQPSQERVDKSHQSVGKGTNFSLPLQQTSGSQPNRGSATLGHLSMADIVRMGASSDKSSHIASEASHLPVDTVNPETTPPRPEVDEGLESSHGTNTLGNAAAQCGSIDEQPVPEQMGATSGSSLLDSPAILNQIDLDDIANLSKSSQSYESQLARNDALTLYALDSSRQTTGDRTRGASTDDDHLLTISECSSSHELTNKLRGDCSATLPEDLTVDASKVGTSLQHLSLGKSEEVTSLIEDERSVVIPDHLQNFSDYCLDLTFGIYGSGDKSPVARETYAAAPEGGAPARLSSRNEFLPIGSIDWRDRSSLPSKLESQTHVSAVEGASALQASNAGYHELPAAAQIPTPPRALDPNAFPLFRSSDTPTFHGASLGARSAFHQASSSYPPSGFGDLSMRPDHTLVESHQAMRPDKSVFIRYFNPMATPVQQYREPREQFRGLGSVRSFHQSPPVVSHYSRGFASSSSLPRNVIQNVPAINPNEDFLPPQHMRRNNLAFGQEDRLSTGWNYARLGSGTTSNVPAMFHQGWPGPRPNQPHSGHQLNLPPPPLQGYQTFGRGTSNSPQSEGGQWDPRNSFFGSEPSSSQRGPFNPPDRPWNF